MIDQQLMDYFKFDQDDLYANQNGRFTDKQQARLIQEDKSSRKVSLILGGVLALVGLGGLLGAIFAIIANPDPAFAIGFGIGFGIVWPLVWGGIGYALIRSALSKHQFKLAMVRGLANIVRGESTDSDGHHHTYYELHVGGHTFSVESDTADVIMQGEEYVLYYVDGSSEILSAEALGKPK